MYKLIESQEDMIYVDSVENVKIKVPKTQCNGLAQIKPMPAVSNEREYEMSIMEPQFGVGIRELSKDRNAKSACVLISDATRKVPTSKVAGYIVRELCKGGVPIENIIFIVAIGVHRVATNVEMREMLGEELYGKVKIENHTPYDYDNLVNLGCTSLLTPIEVNKKAYECDIHISIGKVEPHEFAGFSGGRKSVLPGISSEKTIMANHAPKMLSMDNSVPGSIDENPIHKDMLETAEKFRLDFVVNFVINHNNEVSKIFCGSLKESHLAAVEYLRGYCNVEFEKADVIVTTPGNPLNIDFYQSLKPIIAMTDILDSDTIVALYCNCKEGINSEDMMKPFRNCKYVDEIIDYATKNYKIQMDHALLLSKVIKKNVKMLVYSPNVKAEDIESMYMIPCKSIDEMMSKAIELSGKENPKILFYPQAQRSLPIIIT